MEKKNFQDFLNYYYVNQNIISKSKRPEILLLLNEAEIKYQAQLADSVNPIFMINKIFLKQKLLFWSKWFNMSIFLFLIYISFDWNFSLFKYIYTKSKYFFENFWNVKKNDKENIKNEEKEDEIVGLTSLFEKDSEFKLAKNIQDRLADVKGIDEVKEEIEEIVCMLKQPHKY